jgi:hypothetical protein
MDDNDFFEKLRAFRKEYEKIFREASDQKLVEMHNGACGIGAWGFYVAEYTHARADELKRRFPDTTVIIFKNEFGTESYSLKKRGVWIAHINGVKTLACSELDDHPPTKSWIDPINKDSPGKIPDSMSLN